MKRLLLFFVFLFAQIALSLFAGFAALGAAVPADSVRGGAQYLGVELSGRSMAEASALVEQISESQLNKGMAEFTYRETKFIFRFTEIALRADYSQLAQSLAARGSGAYYNNMFTAFIRQYGADPAPLFTVDVEAFREKLRLMKTYVDSAPVNADISYSPEEGIVHSPSWQGADLDVDGQFEYIMSAFLADPFSPMELDSNAMIAATALLVAEPRVADSMLADVDAILASIDVPVPQGHDLALLTQAAEAINKVWVPKKGAASAPFSFMRYLDEAGLSSGGGAPPEYGFVATALMHALLVCGCDYAAMEAPISPDAADYSGLPGFGIMLSAVAGDGNTDGGGAADLTDLPDFRFTNSLDSNIVIFSGIEDGELTVIVAGSSKLLGGRAAPHEIHSSIADGRAQLFKDGKKIAEQ
ncbi:MAG: hypothetical protein FWH01_07665 [Oscillospiraceae bacterium]|nr:hypothetical protein [Oscillospiraceae bacterium]